MAELVKPMETNKSAPGRSQGPAKARPLPAGPSKAFVFLGHGHEDVVCHESRQAIPDGITLVTFTECGEPNMLPVVGRILEAMKEKPELFKKLGSDPSDATISEIKQKLGGQMMHVYTKGMKYPSLEYSPLSEFQPPEKNGKEYQFYFRSGIYELPLKLPSFEKEWSLPAEGPILHNHLKYEFHPSFTFLKYGHLTVGKNLPTAKSMYKGSVFPDEATINTVLQEHERGEDVFLPVEDAFSLGPGVYYWLICRGRVADEPEEVQALAEKVRAESRLRQETRKAGKRRQRGRRKTYRKKRTH